MCNKDEASPSQFTLGLSLTNLISKSSTCSIYHAILSELKPSTCARNMNEQLF